MQAKVDQVGEQSNRNSQAIDDARAQLKQVDERAQGGISAASERAATADAHAGEAMTRANRAGQDAIAAQSTADKALRDVDGLRSVISNLDDYRLQSSVTVPFSFDKYSLDASSRAELDKLAGEVKSGKRFFIAVEGYTDSVGNAQYNEALSRRRADAVVQYLVGKHDVPIYRIHMIGLGKQKPVDESRGAAARAKNRRVEVKVFSADADVSAAAPKAAVATTSSVR